MDTNSSKLPTTERIMTVFNVSKINLVKTCVVSDVEFLSKAKGAGFQKGDLLLHQEGQKTKQPKLFLRSTTEQDFDLGNSGLCMVARVVPLVGVNAEEGNRSPASNISILSSEAVCKASPWIKRRKAYDQKFDVTAQFASCSLSTADFFEPGAVKAPFTEFVKECGSLPKVIDFGSQPSFSPDDRCMCHDATSIQQPWSIINSQGERSKSSYRCDEDTFKGAIFGWNL
jgi:hypothetical protein